MEMHLRGQYRAAIAHFLSAANVDSGFTVPMLWAIQASCNLEEFEQAAAIQEELVANRGRLSPAEQLGCDYFGALLAGDRGLALRLLRRVSELVPDSEVLTQLGRAALLFNQPRYAVEVLERLDPEAGWTPSWTPYWRRLTEAYHLLGDHQRESTAAQRGRRQHPESLAALLYDARANAALGDVDATRRIADEAVSLTPDPFATPGDVLFAAAKELKAHGNSAASAAMLSRAIDWQRDHCATEQRPYAAQMTLARMLYDAAHLVEASEVLAEMQRERPDDVDLIGCRGAIAAREGDVGAAQSAISKLRGKTGRFHFGKHLLWSARIAAILGDEAAASASLRGAFARGCSFDIELHTDIDLALLSEYPWFRELMRPKG
jgi:predicted Zn-dependent protease